MKFRHINFDGGAGGEGGGGGTALNFETVDAAVAALEKEHGFIIRTKDQESEFLQNHSQSIIGDKTRELYTSFDNEIERISQVKREDGEKTQDYLARVLTTGTERERQLSTQVDELNTQITKLREEGGSSKEIGELKKQMDTLKEQYKKEIEDRDNKLATFTENQFKARIDSKIQEALGQYRPNYDKGMDKAIHNSVETAAIVQFNEKYVAKETNGVITWYDRATDKPMMDTKTGGAQGVATLILPFIESILKEDRQQGGAGGAGGAGAAGGGEGEFVLNDVPDTIKTKTALISWMISEKKMDKNDAKFNKYYTATAAAKNIEAI